MTLGLTNRVLEWYLKQSSELHGDWPFIVSMLYFSTRFDWPNRLSLFGRSFTVWPDSNDKESFKVMLSHKVQRRRAITDFQIDKPV